MGSLKGKRALVTGAAHGIGRAIAEDLIKAGCDVFIHYHERDEGLQDLLDLAQSLSQRAGSFSADLTVEDQAVDCVAKAVGFLGGLEALVNNTGGMVARRLIGEIDRDFWQKAMDVNMTTMMLVTREAVPHLAEAGGASIVNNASLAGRKGGHGGSLAYATSKGAVLTWTRALATELVPRGIRVNAVAPGLILGTLFHGTFTTKESAEATIAAIPLGRAGNVYDVSRAVVFLASEYDGFITGETIDINGGVYCA
jgi:3-oxoacyl-[acyl-carrier protein] reductase